MAGLVGYFVFRDGDASVAFLSAAFGFETVVEQRGDDGGLWHVELRAGDAVIMGGTATDEQAADEPWGRPGGHGLYLLVDDVDATYERAIGAGARSVFGPEDTEWGTRRARILDLDGYEWSFGTYQPGQAWG
jgi:uncharacterized glyoxalase superfamily protein PhnB